MTTRANKELKRNQEMLFNGFSIFLRKGRIIAYASEFGESLRPLVPRSVVRNLYGASLTYVFVRYCILYHKG